MNNPTSRIVHEYLKNNPLLQNYLSQGLINYSALARKLLPLVKKQNKNARIESVLIAIQRFTHDLSAKDTTKTIQKILAATEVSLSGDIIEIIFERTKSTEKRLYERMKKPRDSGVCIINETRHQIALYVSKHLYHLFRDIPYTHKIDDLSVIGLHETTISKKLNSQYVPGYFSHLTLLFAQNNISIVELISCHAHILIFVQSKDAVRGYELLKN